MKIAVLRLLLVCALASAQLGGITHALSHLNGNGPPAGLAHSHHCAVCDAYNVFDHGISGATTNSPSPLIYPALLPAAGREFFAAEISPFVIRAPPV